MNRVIKAGLAVLVTSLAAAPAAWGQAASVDDPTVVEAGSVTVHITLSAPAGAGGVTVDYTTAVDTGEHPATVTSDFSTTSATATFAEGETSKDVVVPVNPDGNCEFDETFRLVLSNPTGGASIAKSVGVVTLTNDDGLCLFVSDPTVTETTGAGSSATATFNVTLNGPVPPSGLTLHYNTSSAGGLARPASATSDYTQIGDSVLTFAAGDPETKSVNVNVVADVNDEYDEQFRLVTGQFNSTPSLSVGKHVGVATIVDDDAPPTVSITDGQLSKAVSDGSNSIVNFGISLSAASGKKVYVDFETQDITAQAGVDYVAKKGTMQFNEGIISQQIQGGIVALGDSLDTTRTFRVALSLRTHLTSSKANFTTSDLQRTITIDGQPRVIVDVTPPENLGGPSKVALNEPLARDMTVPFWLTRTFGDGQIGGFTSEYDTLHSDTAFFVDTTDEGKPITISGVPTTIVEWINAHSVKIPTNPALWGTNRTFSYAQDYDDGTLQGGTDAQTLGDSEGIGTITSVGPNAKIAAATVNEGAAGTTTQASLTVTLDSPAPQAISLAYATADGSAKAPGDYVAAPAGSRVSFATGETSKTINITVNGNDNYEGDKTFSVVLSDPVNAQLPAATKTGVVTIKNDDGVPGLVVSDVVVAEPRGTTSKVEIPVLLSSSTATTLNAAYATADESAVAGLNYAQTTGTLTFKPGETSHTISIPITGDATVTEDLTFLLTIQDTVPGSAAKVVRVTLTDSDLTTSQMPLISVNDASARRTATAAAPVAFTVRLDRPLTRRVSVTYATESGTAVAGRDFVPQAGTLTIPAGQLAATVTVPTLINPGNRSNATFSLVLANPVSGVLGRARGSGIVINADEIGLPFRHGRVSASRILCRSARRCPGVLASWTAPAAGTVRLRITAKLPAGKGKRRTVVLASRSLKVRRGAGQVRVRRVSRRQAPRLLRRLRAAKIRSVGLSLTFTTNLGEQHRTTRTAPLAR